MEEDRLIPLKFGRDEFVKPPVAVARFPRELPMPPRSYVERGFNVQQWTEMPFGGHFAAMEQPVLLAEDIIKFLEKSFKSYLSPGTGCLSNELFVAKGPG